MKTIAIINMKGGCAKTTTSVNMGYILAEDYDKKVLIIDNDKQGNLSKACGVWNDEAPSFADVLTGDKTLTDVMQLGANGNIAVVRKRQTRLHLLRKVLCNILRGREQQEIIRHSLRSIWRDRMVYRNKEGYADPTAGAAIHEAEPKAKKKEYNPEVTNLVSVLKQMIDIAGYEMVGRIVLRDKDTRKEYR